MSPIGVSAQIAAHIENIEMVSLLYEFFRDLSSVDQTKTSFHKTDMEICSLLYGPSRAGLEHAAY